MNRTRFPYEDLIFENRNKAYGAYDLRVNYEVNLMKAFFIGLGSLSFVVFVIFWINRPDIPEIVFKETSEFDLTKVYVMETNTAEASVPVKQQNKTRTIPPPATPIDPLAFKPVKDPVEPEVLPVEPILPSGPIEPLPGSEPGSGSPGNFTASNVAGNGNGTGPVIVSSAVVDKQPLFPGGMDGFYKYLSQHMRFPEAAKREGISAKLFVSFVIDKEGNLVEIEFIKKAGFGMEESVMAVLEKSPKWIPGQVGNEHVNTKMILPVNFNLVQ
jgi:periplasmic protein TonB